MDSMRYFYNKQGKTLRTPFSHILVTAVILVAISFFSAVLEVAAEDEFIKNLRFKAEQGNIEAQISFGLYYRTGLFGVPQDYKEALKWYRKAAEQGDAKAQSVLGVMYYNGQGVPQDYKEALKWYRKAAEQGNALAQNNLGVMYYFGQGVPQNYKEAEKWCRKAAEQGDAKAQSVLGVMYYNGQGVPQDYKEALKWYRKAAEQGNALAQNNLGVMYDNGKGVLQDYVKAYAWWNLAAAKGHENSSKNRESLSQVMTPQQIAAAQELSAQLLRTIEGADDEQQCGLPYKEGTQIKGTGTGFFVSRNGHVLTCHHVINCNGALKIRTKS